jgi:hypothetical protein
VAGIRRDVRDECARISPTARFALRRCALDSLRHEWAAGLVQVGVGVWRIAGDRLVRVRRYIDAKR